MKTLLPLLKTKLILVSFVVACTAILANNFIQRNNLFKFSETKETIAKPDNVAAKTKKVGSKKINLQLRENSFKEASASFEATVTSDQPDYAPRSTATFTGSGYAPDEDVVLKVKNLPYPCNTVFSDSSYLPWTVTADDNGHFVTTWTDCNCPDNPLPDGSDIVVVSGGSATTTNDDITRSAQMESLPEILKFDVKVFSNPSQHQFALYLEDANNEKVRIIVYDGLGRQVKMFEKDNGNIPIHFGMDLKSGVYIVEVRQGDNRKTIKLVKQ